MVLKKDIIHLIASIISIFVFLFGYSSLPVLLGNASHEVTNPNITNSFNSLNSIALTFIGYPLYGFIDTWVIISLMNIITSFLNHIGITLFYDNTYYRGKANEIIFLVIGVLVLLPIIVGLNLLFLNIVFGGFTNFWSYLLFIFSILSTSFYLFQWSNDWSAPEDWVKENERKKVRHY